MPLPNVLFDWEREPVEISGPPFPLVASPKKRVPGGNRRFHPLRESKNRWVIRSPAADDPWPVIRILYELPAHLFALPEPVFVLAVFERETFRLAARLVTREEALGLLARSGNSPRSELTREARAILLVQQELKRSGKLPTKTAIARELKVDRRTLNNWRAFKVAYAELKAKSVKCPPRGWKSKSGDIEAKWESGK